MKKRASVSTKKNSNSFAKKIVIAILVILLVVLIASAVYSFMSNNITGKAVDSAHPIIVTAPATCVLGSVCGPIKVDTIKSSPFIISYWWRLVPSSGANIDNIIYPQGGLLGSKAIILSNYNATNASLYPVIQSLVPLSRVELWAMIRNIGDSRNLTSYSPVARINITNPSPIIKISGPQKCLNNSLCGPFRISSPVTGPVGYQLNISALKLDGTLIRFTNVSTVVSNVNADGSKMSPTSLFEFYISTGSADIYGSYIIKARAWKNYDATISKDSKRINFSQTSAWYDLASVQIVSRGLLAPSISDYPALCKPDETCEPIVINKRNTGAVDLEFEITYLFKTGGNATYCANNYINSLSACAKNSSNKPGTEVLAVSSDPYNYSTIFRNPLYRQIDKIIIKAAVWKDNLRSTWSATRIINFSQGCVNECPARGRVLCSNNSITEHQICGSDFDTDTCLEWGAASACATGWHCVGGSVGCAINGDIESNCNGGDMGCFKYSPRNSEPKTQLCGGVTDYSCRGCNSSYTLITLSDGSNNKACVKKDCTNNCENNNGLASDSVIANAISNNSLTTCGLGTCYTCNSSYHPFNGACVSDTCSGTLPENVTGTKIGVNITTFGSNIWTYNFSLANPAACTWRCNASYHLADINQVNSGCVDGLATCESIGASPGCISGTLINASAVEGSCPSARTCYQCNPGYNWDGSSCARCEPGKIYNGFACVSQGDCLGCKYNNKCLPETNRLNVASFGRAYCGENNLFKVQKVMNADCSSDYECVSNLCGEGKCISLGGQLSQQTGLLKQIEHWLCTLTKGSSAACP